MDIIKLIAEFTGLKSDDIKRNILKDDGTYTDAAEGYISDLLKHKLEKHVFTDDKKKEMAENFEKKGYAEAMKKVNSKLADIFPKAELTAELSIDEVVSKIKSTKVETLPDDQIKLHPLFRELEKNSVSKAEHDKLIAEFQSYKKNVERGQKLMKIEKMADELLQDYKMPDDPKVKQRRMEAFINQSFGGFDFEDEGDDLILIRDGKRFEDAMRNAITASRRIQEQAEIFFDKKIKGTPKGTAEPSKEPLLPQPDKHKEPASLAEYTAVMKTLTGKELIDYGRAYRDKFK